MENRDNPKKPDRKILHALTDPSQEVVALYIELQDPIIPRIINKKDKKVNQLSVYPYASVDGLKGIIQNLTGVDDPFKSTRWIIHFPVVQDIPLSSNLEEIDSLTTAEKEISLLTFYVPVVLCSYRVFLLLWVHTKILWKEFIPGDSLLYLFQLMRFSLNLIQKDRFKPAISKSGSGYYANFEPVLTSEEHEWLTDYSDHIPPQCRYISPRKNERNFVCSPKNRVFATMSYMVKAIIMQAQIKYPTHIAAGELTLEWEKNERAFMDNLTRTSHVPDIRIEKNFAHLIQSWLSFEWKEQKFGRFYTSISLQDPYDEDEPWIFQFHLRSEIDPSLIIPAEMIWNMSEMKGSILPPASYLKQELLTGIGKIAASSQVIRSKLTGLQPSSFECTLSEVSLFLSSDAQILTNNGVDLILPHWWNQNKPKPVIEINAERLPYAPNSGMTGISELIKFDWKISFDDISISPDEFQKAVDLKMPLIRGGGRWISCDSTRIFGVIQNFESRFLRKKPTIGDMIRFSILSDEPDDVAIELTSRDEWLNNLLPLREGTRSYQKVSVPSSFQGFLRPYQVEGFHFLLHCSEFGFGSCLADDMGLGKTPQTIAWLLQIREAKKNPTPALLICPISVVGNWEHEIRRFAPTIRDYTHHGSSRKKGDEFSGIIREYDLVITTYQIAVKDIDDLISIQWSGLILDEAQNIKNPHTKQTKSIKKLCSPLRVALTGTPIENRLLELWSIMDFLNPGYLGKQQAFLERYEGRIETDKNTTALTELKRLISPFIVRRMKTDTSVISDLPEKMEYRVYCSLTYEQVTLYQAVVHNLVENIDHLSNISRKGLILSSITRLKQICNHPGLIATDTEFRAERSGKVTRIIEMLEEVCEDGDSALVFTQYASFAIKIAEILKKHISGKIFLLTGSTPRKERDQLISEFQSGKGSSIFVISLKAGGIGLNLTAATHVFHIDRWWNPAVEDQATDRAYRIGQTRNIQVYMMIASGTLEEKIDEMNLKKRTLAVEVLAQGDDHLTNLSTEELMNVISLRDSVFIEEDEY